ncbi:MAG TPA: IS3 family transposase [Chthoniobacterales bacterium]|nr:IS3 family transposase [Chthoniobacterales bacterium]
METLAPDHSIAQLAEILAVSKSGFYAHRRKACRPRRQQDEQLHRLLKALFFQSRRTYGSPRLCAALRAQGWRCGKNRVARLVRAAGFSVRQKRRFRPQTTQSIHPLALTPNWLAKVPAPERPDQLWQSDITYLHTQEGWLYLAVTLDAYSRKVVGWATASTLHSTLVTEAFQRAWRTRRPAPGLLHHSDRGIQYASARFRAQLHSLGAVSSMSRPGNCYDNALVESFFATLKTECFARRPPASKRQTRLLLFDYIETFYNRRRSHSALGYLTPLDFENRFL